MRSDCQCPQLGRRVTNLCGEMRVIVKRYSKTTVIITRNRGICQLPICKNIHKIFIILLYEAEIYRNCIFTLYKREDSMYIDIENFMKFHGTESSYG